MKFNKKLNITIILISLFLMTFLGALFYAKSLIRPEEIRKIVLSQLERNFPGADIELGKLEVGIGLSVTLLLEKLEIKAKEKGLPLLALQNLEAKIPIWAILTGGGGVNIFINNPKISFIEGAKSNNWLMALPAEAQDNNSRKVFDQRKEDPSISDSPNKEKDLKNYLSVGMVANSFINLKVSDLDVSYQLKNGDTGNFKVKKFLVKNLNIKEQTAFEFQSNIQLKIKENEVKSEILVIGHFDIGNYLRKKELESLVVVKILDTEIINLNQRVPNFNGDFKIILDDKNQIKMDSKITLGNKSKLNFSLLVRRENFVLSDFKSSFAMAELVSFSPLAFREFDFGQSDLLVNADLTISPNKKIVSKIELKTTEDIIFKNDKLMASTSLRAEYKENQLNISSLGKVFDGQIQTKITTMLDINKEIDLNKLSPINIDLKLAGLVFEKDKIQKILYDTNESTVDNSSKGLSKAPDESPSGDASEKKVAPGLPLIPPVVMTLNWDDVLIGGEVFKGKANVSVLKNVLKAEIPDFQYSKGKGKIKVNTILSSPNEVETNFIAEIQSLNLSSLKAFMPPKLLKGIEGEMSGKVSGPVKMSGGKTSYNILANVNLSEGDIKGLNISEKINGLIESLPGLKNQLKKDFVYDVNDSFERVNFEGVLNDQKYQIKKFHFLGLKKAMEINGSGTIYPPPLVKSGEILATFEDKTGKLSVPLEKNVGVRVIPIKLEGPGYDLKIDYGYSVNKLAKSAAKKQGKKVIEKKVQDVAKKIFKGKDQEKAVQQVDKFLKGLFK